MMIFWIVLPRLDDDRSLGGPSPLRSDPVPLANADVGVSGDWRAGKGTATTARPQFERETGRTEEDLWADGT